MLGRRFTLEGECLEHTLGPACSPLDLWELPSLRPPLEQGAPIQTPYAPSLPLAVPPAEDSLFRSDDKLPGDAFALSTGSIWDIIRSQKDLNLPAHKVGGEGGEGRGGGGRNLEEDP